MPGPTVVQPKQKTQFAETVKGYRPASMDKPTGQVATISRSKSYPSTTKLSSPTRGTLKPMGGGTPDRVPAKTRTKPTAGRFDPAIGGTGRTIVAHNGISLGFSNGAGI